MSATILSFPSASHRNFASVDIRDLAANSTPISAGVLATKFTDHFLPVCQASVDLLKADQADFEERCRRMLDADGAAMIDELCAEMEIVGLQMQILVDGLELTRGRLRTAMARL